MSGDWSIVLRPTSRRILGALLGGSRSLTDLAQTTGLSKPSLQPHLKELAALGVIERDARATQQGREVRYHLRNASLHLELDLVTSTAIGWATAGFVDWRFPLTGQIPQDDARDEVTLFLRHVGPRIPSALWNDSFVILYGSAARGEATWKSDLDLRMLFPKPVTSKVEQDIDDVVAWVQETHPHALSVTFGTVQAFIGSRKTLDQEIAAEGMIVWGPRALEGEEVNRALWERMRRYKAISI
ncbi:MAG: Bacterial regulatory protein arsR family [Thermoplasmata archaeon]|jgi:DNA-binding transcriptional ArsR family regulator|nr:Bacterial regulatory protein arsR family [Thermoplasmata archaeon]